MGVLARILSLLSIRIFIYCFKLVNLLNNAFCLIKKRFIKSKHAQTNKKGRYKASA